LAELKIFNGNSRTSPGANLADFIQLARYDLTVFGDDLDWDTDYWKLAGVTFANLDQKSRSYSEKNRLDISFRDFAKAYYRYQHGHRPTKNAVTLTMLRCLDRALTLQYPRNSVADINSGTLDSAVTFARSRYTVEVAYQIGGALRRLATFIADKHLVVCSLQWKNPVNKPSGTVRTGLKARKQREAKLPSPAVLDALT
jgi:hypothetical protein